MLISQYTAKNFGKEYCEICGYGQYPMFMATALGVKPCFDDWVNTGKYEEFIKICREYGLVVVPDVLFKHSNTGKDKVIGGENITTTFAIGERFNKNLKEISGRVHVLVSQSEDRAIQAKKCGWYSVVINNRSTNKPFIDHLRFGKSLGFPDCCVDFFRKYNNWHLYSHPYETFKNTLTIPNHAKGSYYCNNFLMDNTFFFIHNIPCSYRCEKTIELAKKVEEKIKEVEPDYVKKTVEILKKPLLVFGERNFIIFDGKIKGSTLNYRDCQYISNPARPEETINFFDFIKKGNKIIVEKNRMIIMKNDWVLNETNKRPEWFMIDFD